MSNTNKKQQRRRDSQRIARDNMAKKRGEDPVKARKKRARAKAVSYTHLTLPTR